MKLISIISAIMSIVATAISASTQTDYKFGKVTRAELERTDYPAMVDGADAVVLDELNDLLLSTDKTYPQNERYYNVDRIVARPKGFRKQPCQSYIIRVTTNIWRVAKKMI